MGDSLFFIMAGMVLLFSLAAVCAANLIHAALGLVASFFCTAALYLMMRMEFVAAAQVMVYIGGIVIFMVMAILLTSRLGEEDRYVVGWKGRLVGMVTAALLAGVLLRWVLSLDLPSAGRSAPAAGSLAAVGSRLLEPGPEGLVVAFEIISLLLLAALIGAVHLARQPGSGKGEEP